MKIYAVRFKQGKRWVYQLSFTPSQLKKYVMIDGTKEEESSEEDLKNNGYQRKRSPKEVKKMANYIMRPDAMCFNSIWVNCRDGSVYFEEIDGNFGCIILDKDSKLFCPDGQNRKKGIQLAWEEFAEGNDKSLNDFRVPVVLTFGDKSLERRGFIDINKNATKVTKIQQACVVYQQILENGEKGMPIDEVELAEMYAIFNYLNEEKDGPLYDCFKDIPHKNTRKYSPKQIKNDPSKMHTRFVKAQVFVEAMRDKVNLISVVRKDFLHEHFKIRVIRMAQEISVLWTILRNKTFGPLWTNYKHYTFFDSQGYRIINKAYLMLLEEHGDPKYLFDKYLEETSYFKDIKKWLNTRGVKALGLTDEEKDATMANKRGGDVHKESARKICDEIMKKFHADEKSSPKHGKRAAK